MSDEALSRLRFALLGGGSLTVAAVLLVTASTVSTSDSVHYYASFNRAGEGLDAGKSDVKVRGIAVGTVDRIRLNRDGHVTVRFHVRKDVRLPRTTTASSEPISVFGPKDLVLDLGELTGPYLPGNATITKTKTPQDPADTATPAYRLSKAVNPDDLATIFHTLAAGTYGQGPVLRRTITNTAKITDATYADRRTIKNLLNDLNGLSDTLADHGDNWIRFTRNTNTIAPSLYQHPDKVDELLDRTTELSTRIGSSLTHHGANLGGTIDTFSSPVAVLSAERHRIPQLLDSLGLFFASISHVIRVPGPEHTLLGQGVATLPLDICQILIDICPTNP
ncbi:MlaD family protein [Actinomadura opuntiae]|uniref:MlaD family protein n=1 Tax=Actinomadura sp. OS1-43 TaxID=604315 RepID=UPI00255AB0CE|nr:MlaD family protein [Actinomadura sp. OS1-43]MDL4820947.1 MlaD family protein [Actinomadura sp. OS1-43]